jgi:hypothetical protein
MSFQKIQLPARVVADLFKNSLVMSERRNSEEEVMTGQPQYRFLGNHLKKITLIISNTNNFFLPEEQMLFLTRMLDACKMTFADVAVRSQQRSVNINSFQNGNQKSLSYSVSSTKKSNCLLTVLHSRFRNMTNAIICIARASTN